MISSSLNTEKCEGEDHSVAERFDAIIESARHCVDRGEDKGKCHVFLDHSNVCECGDVNLERERMR